MKKITRVSVASLVVLSLLLVSVSSVFASSSASTVDVWSDPVTTANGDAAFSSVVLNEAFLPGTINEDAGMILPVGFTSETGQFGGSGIEINGLATSTDKVDICFSFPTYRYDWRGSIYQWDGSEWVKVSTTIVAPTGENSIYYACTKNAGNGTYALIMGYEGTSE